MENEEKNLPINSEEADEIEFVSKSELKRESHQIQKLGKDLCKLSNEQLTSIPLDEPVLNAIALAHKIRNKRSALKRHYQFIGKLLRARELEPIYQALALLDATHHQHVQQVKDSEYWRERIVNEGYRAIDEFAEQNEQADRQKLRQLLRNYGKAKNETEQSHIKRLLYKEIFASNSSS